MILHSAQNKITESTKRFRVLNCGRRFGKTILAVEEMKAMAMYRTSQIAYFATTYQQARDIAWKTLKKEFYNLHQKGLARINESRLEIEATNINGEKSTIQLRGWENVETCRGLAFDLVIIDEIDSMKNFPMYWQEVIRPTLIDRKGQVMFIGTPKGYSTLYSLMEYSKTRSDWEYFHYTSFDNPHISHEEIEEARTAMTEDRFAQEHLAEFKKMEGLVYKEFRRESHLFDEYDTLPDFKEVICGVDFGYTNPTAILKIGVDGDNNFWILEEWYKTRKTPGQIIQAIKNFHPNKVYADPAEPSKIEELDRDGLNCLEVSKDITAGINAIQDLFKQGRIKINKDCKNLIWELENYHYGERKPDHNEPEKPVKEDDHACDSLRYALYNYEPVVYNQASDKFEAQITDF